MKGFKKAQKDLKNDMLVLFILELLFFVFSIFSSSISLTFTSVIFAILLFVGYNYAKKGEKKAGTIGMVVGILMMLTIISADILDFLLGLFVVLHSSKYNKLIQNKKEYIFAIYIILIFILNKKETQFEFLLISSWCSYPDLNRNSIARSRF